LEQWINTYLKAWNLIMEKEQNVVNMLDYHKYKFGLCPAKVYGSFFIDPNGDLYSCYSLVGNKEFKIGDIYNGPSPFYYRLFYLQDKKLKECLDVKCPYVPLCNAGCLYHAYVEHSDISQKVCQRKFYEDVWLRIKGEIYERICRVQQ